MALLGPMVVVAENSAADLIDVLGKAGAFPIVETRWADAPAAIAEIQPVALAVADPEGTPSPRHLRAVTHCIETRGGPVMPVIALVEKDSTPAIADALAIALDDSTDRLIARLRSALRIRTLHATVLRRAHTAGTKKGIPTSVPADLLDHATVLCVGRGGSYPALSVAIGERVGLIGALSIETAARYLNARDIDGVVIGDGLGPRVVEALLTVLAEDARFRDLPIGMLDNGTVDDERLPNLVRLEDDPVTIDRAGAAVRAAAGVRRPTQARAQVARDRRRRRSRYRPARRAGLLARPRSRGAGGRASAAARSRSHASRSRASPIAAPMSMPRGCSAGWCATSISPAGSSDGSILAAFTETDLRSAHVVARRIASVLRQTMLSPDPDRRAIKPTITLATLKPNDNLSTLVARVGAYPKVAAE